MDWNSVENPEEYMEDWDGFGDAIATLIDSAQNVIEKAGMKGTTLT